jgi:uncharacterized protein (TIGR03435 family)
MKRMLCFIAILAASSGFAQTAPVAETKAPAYDVVSIKPNDHGRGVSVHINDNIFNAIHISLKELVAQAYGTRWDLISGGPSWIESNGFDIQAKVLDADPHALSKLNNQQRGALLRPMLGERFGLKIHTEVKTLPIYELVVVKGTPKFSEASPADKDKRWNNATAGGMIIHNGTLVAHDVSLSRLIDVVAGQLHREVVDKTGLTGSYDIQLNWTRDDDPSPERSAPYLAQALEEQLGLKLVAAKGPVETLVIDHAELPTED